MCIVMESGAPSGTSHCSKVMPLRCEDPLQDRESEWALNTKGVAIVTAITFYYYFLMDKLEFCSSSQ